MFVKSIIEKQYNNFKTKMGEYKFFLLSTKLWIDVSEKKFSLHFYLKIVVRFQITKKYNFYKKAWEQTKSK